MLAKFHHESEKDAASMLKSSFDPYVYWDKFQYRKPSLNAYSPTELWAIIKYHRKLNSSQSPIMSSNKQIFTWVKLPRFEKFFHEFDFNIGGELFPSQTEDDKSERQRLLARGIVEESIASSQLEGASTSRKIAKQFLREGRKAKNESEQMILNNYLTMQLIEAESKKKALSPDLLMELHGLITKGTFTPEGETPRLRWTKDEVYVVHQPSGKIHHQAPDINFVEQELARLIDFTNNDSQSSFIHPIIKAIILHFWLAYLHPFTDGNGRMAWALFY